MKLQEFRKSKGLSQEKFALKLGVSYSFLVKIENGSANASKSFLDKLKKAFPEASIDKIFYS